MDNSTDIRYSSWISLLMFPSISLARFLFSVAQFRFVIAFRPFPSFLLLLYYSFLFIQYLAPRDPDADSDHVQCLTGIIIILL